MDEKGDFAQPTATELMVESIVRLLLTPKGFDEENPDYGVNTRKYLMSLNTSDILDLIKADIDLSINKYLPQFASLIDVSVEYYNFKVYGKRFIVIYVDIVSKDVKRIRIMHDSSNLLSYSLNV
jgi:phage baseplate assembly protein W